MHMELPENGCLRITLSAEDMRKMGLRFEDMNYGDPATRKAIQSLLEYAAQKLHFESGAHLLVEALPIEEGCLLLITTASEHRQTSIRPRRAAGPAVYAIEDENTLFQLADAWKRRFRPTADDTPVIGELASSLYIVEDGYRLIVYDQPPGGTIILTECAHPAGEGDLAAAYVAEHGRALVIGDALDRLAVETR